MHSFTKKSPLIKILNNSLVKLPTPSNINSFWNFGSILGICLMMQILSGIFLSMHYYSSSDLAFSSVSHIMRDVNNGWMIRITHANGASIFFISLYLHMARGIYFNSFNSTHVWMIGTSIALMTMATAFLGYVLPWGQMSFWGATVITNLFSAIPIFGIDIVFWLWGGFAVGEPTLSRFFTIHYLLPLMIAFLVVIHLFFLHQEGSNNPLGLSSNIDKIAFHPYFSYKDLTGFTILFLVFLGIVLIFPWALGDTENFIPANPLLTPVHIQPEWYFLFAYAILRSVPNKLGGVMALASAVLILYSLPLKIQKKSVSNSFSPMKMWVWWGFVSLIFLLTWIGARPVEAPFLGIGQIITSMYFMFYVLILI